jgi:hypothetical protein
MAADPVHLVLPPDPDHAVQLLLANVLALGEQKVDEFKARNGKTFEKARNCQDLLGPWGMKRRYHCLVCDQMLSDQECEDGLPNVFASYYADGFMGVLCTECTCADYWAMTARVVWLADGIRGLPVRAPRSRSSLDELHDASLDGRAQYSRSQRQWILLVTDDETGEKHPWQYERMLDWNPDLVPLEELLKPATYRVLDFLMDGGVPQDALPPPME